MKRLAVLLFLTVASQVQADSFPALYKVVGVASDDVLNVRAESGVHSPIISTLDHDATDIEVTALGPSGQWARVNMSEQSGWVALRFLSRQSASLGLPEAEVLYCFGTEPFWSLNIRQGQSAEITSPEGSWSTSQATMFTRAQGRTDRYAVRFGGSNQAVIRMTGCSDGMSERHYGLEIDLFAKDGLAPGLYSGCCSLAP